MTHRGTPRPLQHDLRTALQQIAHILLTGEAPTGRRAY